MSVVLPLLGCGSFSSPFDVAGRGAGVGLGSNVKAPKTDYVEGYSQVLSSGTYAPAGVERKSLAPVPAPTQKVAAADTNLSGGYALGSVQYEGESGPAPRREATNYGPRRPSQPYAGGQSDFDEADQARRGDYAPEPRYPQGGPGEGGGGDYVVQPGDTLYAVAVRHGTTVDELIAINHLRGADIYAGQRLRIGAGGGYEGRPYAEPRPYREPGGPGAGTPYRDRQADRRGDYPAPPAADVYQERLDGPKSGQRYDGAEGYDQQRAPYRPSYPSDPQGPRERGYEDPRGGNDRSADYTGSSSRFTPDGPFQPSPDAPWRGEAEWRRMKPQGADPDAYEPQIEPSYTPSTPALRRPAAENYDARPPYQPQRTAPKPYAAREPYSGPQTGNGGKGAGGKPSGTYVYTVQRGDTLREIARRNGIGLGELADFNGLPRDARVSAGQELRIPRGEGYDWSRPRPQAGNYAAPAPQVAAEAPQPAAPIAPTAPRPAAETPRPAAARLSAETPRPAAAQLARPAREVRPVAYTEPVGPLPVRAASKPAPAAPGRLAERAPAPDVVADNSAPGPVIIQQPATPHAVMQAPADGAADVAVSDPVPTPAPAMPATTASATPHPASAEHGGARECEALLAAPEARSAKTFRMPVQGMVVAKFGSQDDGSFNDGINFSVPKGTPVKVAENGVVAYAGDELAGFGNLVLVRHADGYVTAYAHNDELLVKKCDVVKRGQIIAKAGASGKATAPQLHFELRRESKPMDPDGHFSGT